MTEANRTEDERVNGRWVGDVLWWDINDENISDEELKLWVRSNLPEESAFRSTAGGLVTYHMRAYANRRRAIAEYMGGRRLHEENVQLRERLERMKTLAADLQREIETLGEMFEELRA